MNPLSGASTSEPKKAKVKATAPTTEADTERNEGSGRRRVQREALGELQDLDRLRWLVRRDPRGYEEEFKEKLRHFDAQLVLLAVNPGKEGKELSQLIGFITATASCFPKLSETLPGRLISLLEQQADALNPKIRRNIATGLILMRKRRMMEPTTLLPLCFKLFRCRDKTLRKILFCHIVNDIKGLNKQARNNQVNRQMQNFMYTMLRDSNETAAKKSLDVMIELFRRGIWNDAKTADVISTACFTSSSRLMVSALKFFLNSDRVKDDNEESSSSEDFDYETNEAVVSRAMAGPLALGADDLKRVTRKGSHSKRTRKRQRKARKELKDLRRRARSADEKNELGKFSAVLLVNDPQGFSEKLFQLLKKPGMRFEVKLMIMSLISRLIAAHQVVIVNFYPYLQRYLKPHQEFIAYILSLLAQACHEYIDPDTLQPLVRTISDNFVNDRSSPENMAAGLNAIREMCKRSPYIMDATLLRDLVQYQKNRHKEVVAASKSLIQLYRVANPELLVKKDRGKKAQEALVQGKGPTGLEYAADEASLRVPGAALYEEYLRKKEAGLESESESDGDSDDSFDSDDFGSDDDEEDEVPKLVSASKRGRAAQANEDEDEDDESDSPLQSSDDDDDDNEESDEDEDDDDEDDNDEDDKEDTVDTTPALPIEATRIFTDEDFRAMRRLRTEEELGLHKVKTLGEMVSVNSIAVHVHEKMDYNQRMESVKKGREDRAKFGSRKGASERGSTTNIEKKKNQPFVLARQQAKVRAKIFQDIHTKQRIRAKSARHSTSLKKRRRS